MISKIQGYTIEVCAFASKAVVTGMKSLSPSLLEKKEAAAALYKKFKIRDALTLYYELLEELPGALFLGNIGICLFELGDYKGMTD